MISLVWRLPKTKEKEEEEDNAKHNFYTSSIPNSDSLDLVINKRCREFLGKKIFSILL